MKFIEKFCDKFVKFGGMFIAFMLLLGAIVELIKYLQS